MITRFLPRSRGSYRDISSIHDSLCAFSIKRKSWLQRVFHQHTDSLSFLSFSAHSAVGFGSPLQRVPVSPGCLELVDQAFYSSLACVPADFQGRSLAGSYYNSCPLFFNSTIWTQLVKSVLNGLDIPLTLSLYIALPQTCGLSSRLIHYSCPQYNNTAAFFILGRHSEIHMMLLCISYLPSAF